MKVAAEKAKQNQLISGLTGFCLLTIMTRLPICFKGLRICWKGGKSRRLNVLRAFVCSLFLKCTANMTWLSISRMV